MDRLAYEGNLPLEIKPADDALSAESLDQLNQPAIEILELLESHPPPRPDDKGNADLHRLEAKLDILIRMLSRLTRDDSVSGNVQLARIDHEGLKWQGPSAARAGDIVQVSVYFHPLCPEPVLFSGRVLQQEGNSGQLKFSVMGDITADWLDRFLFRKHRQAVASSRAHP